MCIFIIKNRTQFEFIHFKFRKNKHFIVRLDHLSCKVECKKVRITKEMNQMETQTIKTAPKFDKKSFTKKDVFRTKNSIMFMLNFLPNQQMPAHNHPGYELYLHVVQGEGTFTINTETVDVVEDDIIHC